jgi:CO dehydrogenase maturation factor
VRIAISGKGGSGKTTLAGTLARALAQHGATVLAIDGDPNPTLGLTLGISMADVDQIPAIPQDLLETVAAPDGTSTRRLRLTIPTLVATYGAQAPDGVTLLIAGRVEHAARGCMCGTHAAVRGILRELITNGEGITLADMEAGIEHLSRATISDVDLLLVVVEPYYKSIFTAEKVVEMARELGIARIVAIANKVRNADDHQAILAACQRWNVEVIAEVPFDEALRDAEQNHQAPMDAALDSDAVRAVQALAGRLLAIPAS